MLYVLYNVESKISKLTTQNFIEAFHFSEKFSNIKYTHIFDLLFAAAAQRTYI